MKFDKKYTEYWSSAVNKSVDGTVIAGADHVKNFLDLLDIHRSDRVLDLGCSFGRMHQILSKYSDHIYGVDPDPFAVTEASQYPYIDVRQGVAERTGFDAAFFDVVFCWAVFDVVDHKKGFQEINRILKPGGTLVLTGKNHRYPADDVLGFTAEKNAFLKSHPNKFTKLDTLVSQINVLGLEIKKLFLFNNRGDLGLLKYEESALDSPEFNAYEYLLLATKIDEVNTTQLETFELDCAFTQTSISMAALQGFDHPKAMFESLGIT